MFRLFLLPIACVASLLCASPLVLAADPVSPRNANGSITKAIPQPDGKVIVVGNFSYVGNVEKAGIARLNAAGTLDPTFDVGTGVNGTIDLIAVQSDGKVLIVGPFTTVNGTTRNGVARLNPDGKLDLNFDVGLGATGAIYDLQLDSSGKPVLSGRFDHFNNVTGKMIVRLNLDGSVDPTFDAGKNLIPLTGAPGAEGIKRFSFYPDGRLIVIGYFQASANRYDIARVAVDGTIDQSFQASVVSNAAVVAQPDGRILIGDGGVNQGLDGLNRVNADGQTDMTFHATANHPKEIRLLPDGRILFLDSVLKRVTSTGSNDPTFVSPQIASGNSGSPVLKGMEVQADGRIVIYGSFHQVNGVDRIGVARLLTDGSIDPSFVPDQSIIATGFVLNLSTRVVVGTGEHVLIGGFIVDGNAPKKVMIRGIGPSLASSAPGLPMPLADPRLTLRNSGGMAIAQNDNWRTTQIGGVITSDQASDIQASGIAPKDDAESAMIVTLAPGAYTAIVEGASGSGGTALVEMYDLDGSTTTRVANISTRGGVATGDNVLIAGAILGGTHPTEILVRALGPSLTASGVTNALQDPTLTLHNANGFLVGSNENWKDNQESDIRSAEAASTDDREAAVLSVLQPGNYTAVVRGKNNATGVALVEFYSL